MGEECSAHEDVRNAYIVLVVMPERRRPLGISIRRRESIKMDVGEISFAGVGFISPRIGTGGRSL
jgi:hypothetical protein